MKDTENKVVELSDEDLSQVYGGMTGIGKTCMCDTSKKSMSCINLVKKGKLPECQSCGLNDGIGIGIGVETFYDF